MGLAGLAVAGRSLAGKMTIPEPASVAAGEARCLPSSLPSTSVLVGYGAVFDYAGSRILDRLWHRMHEGDLLGIARSPSPVDAYESIDVYRREGRVGYLAVFGPRHGTLARRLHMGAAFVGRIQCLHPSGVPFVEVFSPEGPCEGLPLVRLSGLPDTP
jgi:hypothetical protein